MAGCRDERFEKMLYAYELGMLSEEDREAVERHHLECEHCFQRAKKFRDAARLLRVDPGIRQYILAAQQEERPSAEDRRPERQWSDVKSKIWSPWVKTVLAAAALVILFFQPWKIEITPRQEAFAAENLLAIMYFDNLAESGDPQNLGEIIANLLITDLSESHNFQVVSSQRLYDLFRLLGEDGPRAINNTAALRVARKAEARWMLTGKILQTEPEYVITSQLIDVASGDILNTQKVTGDSAAVIFTVADSLSYRIRTELPLGAKPSTEEPDRIVADLTTHSREAFQYYLEGVDYYQRRYLAEAVASFEKALEYDSTFAMVYYYLAILKDNALLAKAVEYSGKAARKDRYYIEGLRARKTRNTTLALSIYQQLIDDYPQEKEAYYAMGTLKFEIGAYDEAIDRFNIAVALDPFFGAAYNLLSYSYGRLGNLNMALEMNQKFIFLEPNEPNPYDSRGDIFVGFKMYDRAIESFKKAIEKKSDFYASWKNLGRVYTYSGDFAEAETCFRVIASVADIYVWTDGKMLLAQNLIYRGKYQEALTVLAEGSRDDKKAHGEERYATYHHYAALIYEHLEIFDSALAEIAVAQEIVRRTYPQDRIYWQRYYVRILAEAGDIVSARQTAENLKASLEDAGRPLGDYWYSRGAMDLAEGKLAEAEGDFRRAVSESDSFDYSAHYMLGQIFVESNRPEEAIEQFDKLLEDQNDHPENWALWEAEVYYYLGLAYQQSGRVREAIDNFTKYLDVRKDADSRIKSVLDADEMRAALIARGSS